MNKIFIVVLLPLFLLSGCHSINNVKYRKIYAKDIKQEVAKASEKPGAVKITKATGKEVQKQEQRVKPGAIKAVSKKKQAEKKKRKSKIKELIIESGTVNYNRETQNAVFKNNVKVFAEDIRMYSKKLESVDYRESAEATGNVRVFYDKYDLKIKSKNFSYADKFNTVKAYNDVVVDKYLENGNTMTMYAQEVVFDSGNDVLTAYSGKKRVKLVYNDIVAFSDKVVYNERKREMELTGKPILKKKKSIFLSQTVRFDVDKKTMKLEKEIWSKIFYEDFEETKKEYEGKVK